MRTRPAADIAEDNESGAAAACGTRRSTNAEVPQVVLHVGRDRDKRRRLSEIAVLRAGEDGRVRVATAWHVDTGFGSAAGDLRNMVRDRGVL